MKGKIVLADSGFISVETENDCMNERRTSSSESKKDKLNLLMSRVQSYKEQYADVKEEI